jgi:hypothetical protein
MRTRLSHLAAGLVILSFMFLFGATNVVAQDSTQIVERVNVTVDTPTLCGQIVYGRGTLATESRFRGANGPCGSTEVVYPGEESIPVAPNSCLDTLGRHRLPPCRG